MSIAPDRILFSDSHLLAVSKRAGELVVRGKGDVGKLPLLDFLRKDFPGIRAVHRLDFGTSGIVVFARTWQAEEAIRTSHFAGWEKTYRALVAGRVERDRGMIRMPLPARRSKDAVPAETRYTVVRRFANSTEVLCSITTGRHHQIRRHFAGMGHPLVCDDLYGSIPYNRTFMREFGYRSFFLHAETLAFPHPITGERMVLTAPLPRAFVDVLMRLAACS